MKKYVTFLVALLLLTILASCSGPSETSEADILSDIQNEDLFFQKYGLSIESSTITKRQTNPDDKTDYVWVKATASNQEFTYDFECEMTYVLYNDGWILEDYDKTSSSIAPNYYPTEDDAMAEIEKYYNDCSLTSSSWSGSTMFYFFEREENKYCLYTRYKIELSYEFSPDSGWTHTISEGVTGYALDIEGEWFYQDDERSFYINILSVENNKVILEYDLENISISSYSTTTRRSDGPVEMDLRLDGPDGGGYDASIVFSSTTVYGHIGIYVGRIKALSNSSGYGLSCDGYFLTRKN